MSMASLPSKSYKTLCFLTIFLVTSSGWSFSRPNKYFRRSLSECTPGDNYCTRLCKSEGAYCADDRTCICNPAKMMITPSTSPSSLPTYSEEVFECDTDVCKIACEPKDGYCDQNGICRCIG